MEDLIYIFMGAFLICGAWYLNYRIKHRRFYAMINDMPGPTPWPLVGNGLHFRGSPYDITKSLLHLMQKYKPLFRLWFGPKPYVVILQPEHAMAILNSPHALNKSEPVRHIGSAWLGDCLLLSKGAKWKKHRKIIVSAFSQKILDGYMRIFVDQSEKMVKHLKKEANTNIPFNIFDYIGRATLDTICGTAMGVDVNSQSYPCSYFNAVTNQIEIMALRGLKVWLYPEFIFNLTSYGIQQAVNVPILTDFTRKVISERKLKQKNIADITESDSAIMYGKNPSQKPFLDLLMDVTEDDPLFTEKELREEVDIFMVGGYETTAVTNSFTLLCLAANKDVQQKVYEELLGIFSDSDRPVNIADLPRMTYLEMVIKETMRLFPTVPMLIRDISADIKLGKHTLPAGSSCIISVYSLHHDSKLWRDPYTFDPERFSPANVGRIRPGSYIPFSAGSRNCIGYKYAMMAMKTLLATVLRSYEVDTELKLREIKCAFEVTLKLKGGHMLNIKTRRK